MSLANAVKDLSDSINCLNELLGVGGRVIHLSNLLTTISNQTNPTTMTQRKGNENKKTNRKGIVVRKFNTQAIVLEHVDVAIPLLQNQIHSISMQNKENKTSAGKEEQQLPLVQNLTTTLTSSTVVVGPNGTGKTSLFRTLSGLWLPKNGRVEVPNGMYVMPQRSHFIYQGLLWEQVAYPHEKEVQGNTIEMQAIQKWLIQVGLKEVVETRGVNCNDADFHTSLSGGQQQRVMWARMLYNVVSRGSKVTGDQGEDLTHCLKQDTADVRVAKFVLLDEATSAISNDWVKKLYDIAKKEGIVLISIAHSKEVEMYHENVLELGKKGTWKHTRRE